MGKDYVLPGLFTLLGPPTIVTMTAVLLYLMPSELRTALTIWTLASFPLAVLFGHFVLSEQ